MIPVEDLKPNKRFDNLASPGGKVDHVDIYFNAVIPGWRSRMPIWFFGMPQRPTKRASQSNAHPARRHNRRLFRVSRERSCATMPKRRTSCRNRMCRHSPIWILFAVKPGLSTWLTRIAFNAALARVRRRRPMAPLEEVDAQDNRSSGRLIDFPSPLPSNPETESQLHAGSQAS